VARLTSIEICAGAGGQALGLEQAGFQHRALVELDPHACATLRFNRPYWNTIEDDVTQWHATRYRGQVDLLAGGVPCPPFSKAGRQLGASDERDLFPQALRLIRECRPRAVMLENVRGLLDPVFDEYRADLEEQLREEGYLATWKLTKPRTSASRSSGHGRFSWRFRQTILRTSPGPFRCEGASRPWVKPSRI
jgi:DNA (cytosine-5)-methyltransferase 1